MNKILVIGFYRMFEKWRLTQPPERANTARHVYNIAGLAGYEPTTEVILLYGYDYELVQYAIEHKYTVKYVEM